MEWRYVSVARSFDAAYVSLSSGHLPDGHFPGEFPTLLLSQTDKTCICVIDTVTVLNMQTRSLCGGVGLFSLTQCSPRRNEL